MALDRKSSEFGSALASELASNWYYLLVDPNEVDPINQNKIITQAEMIKAFLPLSVSSSNDVGTVNGDKSVTFAEYIQQAGYHEDLGNKTGATTVNWSSGPPMKKITLTGNVTLTFTAPAQSGVYLLQLVQDATGSRTVTWPTFKSGYPIIRFEPTHETIVPLLYDGTSWHHFGAELEGKQYNITDDPEYAAARAANDFNNNSTTGFLTKCCNRALALGCDTIVVPVDTTLTNGYYNISDTWKIPNGLHVECPGNIQATWAVGVAKPAVEVGVANGLNGYVHLHFGIINRQNATQWDSTSDVGLRIHNCRGCFIHFDSIRFFTVNLQCYATDDDGWAYNFIRLGLLIGGMYNLHMVNVNETSWVNQNLFLNGNFNTSTDVRARVAAAHPDPETNGYYPRGVYMEGYYPGGDHGMNANCWLAPNFEVSPSGWTKASPWEIKCDLAGPNLMLFCRHEYGGTDTAFLRVDGSTTYVRHNVATLSYVTSLATSAPHYLIDDPSDVGDYNRVISQQWETAYGSGQSWVSPNWAAYATQFNSSGDVMIPGYTWKFTFSPYTESMESLSTGRTVGADYVELASGESEVVGVMIDARYLKQFMFQPLCDNDGAGPTKYDRVRVCIQCYDAAGAILSGSSPRYARVGNYGYAGSGSGYLNGAYFVTSTGDFARMITLREEVKSAFLAVYAYNEGGTLARVKNFNIRSLDGAAINVYSRLGAAYDFHTRYYDGIPSGSLKGNWKEGNIVMQYNPASMQESLGWIYVATNTWAPLNRINAGTTAPSDTNQLWIDTNGL
jgi:hypothetical protein